LRTLILDSGAFIAAERYSARLSEYLAVAIEKQWNVATSAAVIAEVWRSPAKPGIGRLLKSIDTFAALDVRRAFLAGALLGSSETSQVIDACVATLALELQPSVVLTSDANDIEALVKAAGGRCRIGIDRTAPILIEPI
jgi:hypothetical protein